MMRTNSETTIFEMASVRHLGFVFVTTSSFRIRELYLMLLILC